MKPPKTWDDGIGTGRISCGVLLGAQFFFEDPKKSFDFRNRKFSEKIADFMNQRFKMSPARNLQRFRVEHAT